MNTSSRDEGQLTQNQNNAMSDDPGASDRKSFTPGRDGKKISVERSPEEEAQDQSATEAFGEEGAGVAAKE